MSDSPNNRRLAAILAADVVGYSRMMAADESGTLSALKRHRETVFDPTVVANNGRVFKLIGDGTLVEFGSVVDAVNCALAIQRAIAGDPATEPKITLRIGVNLGDIILDGDDVYGDGVNVAARLEPLAEPGGVCVASIVNESVGNRIDVAFRDGGEVQVKNIDRPIRIWKWHPSNAGSARPTASAVPPPSAAPPAKAESASIAVLPFANMSGDAEQEYFSDGITEDIITDLSKIGGLVVIARNSTFAYKGRNVDIRTVGRELGVRTVLEGSIRKAGNRVRITGQLIDAGTGSHLWAERYDRDLNDIFAVQDEVTREIVSALRLTLSPAEKAKITNVDTTSSEAHDCVLRARQLLSRPGSREVFERSVVLLNRAVELDPEYAEAYACLGLAYNYDFHNNWSGKREESLAEGARCAEIAIARAPNDPFAHYVHGVMLAFQNRRGEALAAFDRALEISPNYALAINALGVGAIYAGRHEEAIVRIEQAVKLDPGNTSQYLHFLGMAYLLARKLETAAATLHERILMVPETDFTRMFYASALGHLGRIEEAKAAWRELKGVNPNYSLAVHLSRLAYDGKGDTEFIIEGLAKAGLPGGSLD